VLKIENGTASRVESYDLSVVIPTYNEAENLPILLEKLRSTLSALSYEIIIVDDDSPDGTWAVAQKIGSGSPGIKVIRRMDAKGLSSAVTTGMASARGRVIAVMDADLQHDESILPELYAAVANDTCDICVGSREGEGGSYGDWSATRRFTSYAAKKLAAFLLGPSIKDPMSGFFAVSREYLERTLPTINPSGFKILLEFISRGDDPRLREIGYVFRTRTRGETKLNSTVVLEYILALIDLRFGWLIPNRFVKFAMVGVSGSLVNLVTFASAKELGATLPLAAFAGVQMSILWTYAGNNMFTFSPFRYQGAAFARGLVLYQTVSIYGIVVQLSIVDSVLGNWPNLGQSIWTLYLVYMIGVAFASLGNYFLHSYYTWNRLGFNFARPVRTASIKAV
jgi:dolichol-phosphate mannosyltransferase